jgi:hypothetical protein
MAGQQGRHEPKEAALAAARCLNPHPEQVTDPEFLASDFFDARDAVDGELVGDAGMPADPIRALLRSGSGSTVTSAIRMRSSCLRSLAPVVGAFHSPGRSAASFSSSARPGSGGSTSWTASNACSASARAASLASHRASSERATSRFSGSTWQNARSARSAS